MNFTFMTHAAIALLFLNIGSVFAQAIEIPTTYKSFSSSPASTITYLYQVPDAKATIVFIPGGAGRIGIQPDSSDAIIMMSYFNAMIRSLSDRRATSGQFNVVFFDSPEVLRMSNHWSSARTGDEHLSRIEDVVRTFREKLGKPVWLMGHSMGSISITEFYKRLQDRNSQNLVAGLILSAGQNGTSFNYESTRLPVLVLHHENDGCSGNTVAHAKKISSKLREAGNDTAELVIVSDGYPATGDPCNSGYHMYSGATNEVALVIDRFVSKHSSVE
jgi:hypothetical protein